MKKSSSGCLLQVGGVSRPLKEHDEEHNLLSAPTRSSGEESGKGALFCKLRSEELDLLIPVYKIWKTCA